MAHRTDRLRALEIAICRHGAADGKFETKVWANGKTMVKPEGALGDKAVELARFNELKSQNWKCW